MIEILHRDARCVAVNKPSGIATHRGWADDDDALLQLVRDTVGAYVYPVHRLDRGASGVTLFALDKDAARAFSDAWPGADKRYFAITRGHPPEHLVIDHPIPRAPGLERVPSKTEIWRRDAFGRWVIIDIAVTNRGDRTPERVLVLRVKHCDQRIQIGHCHQ